MNTRVLLLTIATGLFASMWSSDSDRHPRLEQRHVSKAVSIRPFSCPEECRVDLQVDDPLAASENQTSVPISVEDHDVVEPVVGDDYQVFGCVASVYAYDVDPVPQIAESNSAPPVVAEKPVVVESDFPTPPRLIVEPVSQTKTIAPAEEIATQEGWFFDGCAIPLPEKLAVGEYRIVSSDGEIRSMNFTANDLSYHAAENISEAPTVSIVRDGSRHWYFIRVDSLEKTTSRIESLYPECEAPAEALPADVSARWKPFPLDNENAATAVMPISAHSEYEPIAAEVVPESNESAEQFVDWIEETLQTFLLNTDGLLPSLLQNVGFIR